MIKFNGLKLYLMNKYCPMLWMSYPSFDNDKQYAASSAMLYGYFGHRTCTIKSKKIKGIKQAYLTARWLALVADFRYPSWLYDCGIRYEIQEIKNGE